MGAQQTGFVLYSRDILTGRIALTLTPATVRTLGVLIVPAAALLLLQLINPSDFTLAGPFAGIVRYGPCGALLLAAFMSVWFNRGRAALGIACLGFAQLAYCTWITGHVDAPLERQIYTWLCALVPLNMAALTVMAERGLFNTFGLRRLFLLVAQVAGVWLLLKSGYTEIGDWLASHDPLPLLPDLTPLPARTLPIIGLAIAAAAFCALWREHPIDGAMCSAMVTLALALYRVQYPVDFALLMATAALLVMIGVLQDSYRMAFRDELTGLPSRRALNERLMSLGPRFSIAMLDVDHFKQFNDSYGHDTGDHVLKMVAGKLSQIRSGGRAFRYGGEEFALVFPNRNARRVMHELEALRVRIAEHQIQVRDPQRPDEPRLVRKLRRVSGANRGVNVTVSIGIAEVNDTCRTPQEVLQAADRALYRAKEKGRNRISR